MSENPYHYQHVEDKAPHPRDKYVSPLVSLLFGFIWLFVSAFEIMLWALIAWRVPVVVNLGLMLLVIHSICMMYWQFSIVAMRGLDSK